MKKNYSIGQVRSLMVISAVLGFVIGCPNPIPRVIVSCLIGVGCLLVSLNGWTSKNRKIKSIFQIAGSLLLIFLTVICMFSII